MLLNLHFLILQVLYISCSKPFILLSFIILIFYAFHLLCSTSSIYLSNSTYSSSFVFFILHVPHPSCSSSFMSSFLKFLLLYVPHHKILSSLNMFLIINFSHFPFSPFFIPFNSTHPSCFSSFMLRILHVPNPSCSFYVPYVSFIHTPPTLNLPFFTFSMILILYLPHFSCSLFFMFLIIPVPSLSSFSFSISSCSYLSFAIYRTIFFCNTLILYSF